MKLMDKIEATRRDAYESLGIRSDIRNFADSIVTIEDVDIYGVALLSKNPHKSGALLEAGINVIGIRRLKLEDAQLSDFNGR